MLETRNYLRPKKDRLVLDALCAKIMETIIVNVVNHRNLKRRELSETYQLGIDGYVQVIVVLVFHLLVCHKLYRTM